MAATSSYARLFRPSRWRTQSARRCGPSIPCCPSHRCRPWSRWSRNREAIAPLQHRADLELRFCRRSARDARHLQRDRLFRRLAHQEMAIRMTLGSQRGAIVGLVIEVRCQAGRRSAAPLAWRRRRGLGTAAIVALWRQPVRPAGDVLRSNRRPVAGIAASRLPALRAHPSIRCTHCAPNSPVAPPIRSRLPRSPVPRPCDFFLSQGRETTCPIVRQHPPPILRPCKFVIPRTVPSRPGLRGQSRRSLHRISRAWRTMEFETGFRS